jgi:hypothetical protein
MNIILDIVHHLELSNTIFWKLDLFPSSGVRKKMFLFSWTLEKELLLSEQADNF